MQRLTRHTEWHKVGSAIAVWNRARRIHESLCRLSNWNIGNHLVAQGVDRDGMFAVFQGDIHSGSVSGGPKAVRQISYGNGSDQFGFGAAAIRLHFICSPDSNVGESAVAVVRKVHVVRNRSGIEQRNLFEWRFISEH